MQFSKQFVKDLGLQKEVVDALPYAVVGGAFKGTFQVFESLAKVLNYIVPAGQQLKILFLRVWTQNPAGAKFSIVQTNPSLGEPGYPVVGSVPSGVRDYPMLESAGCEVLHGNLRQPVHVVEGSIDFNILNAQPTRHEYGIVWWGVEKSMLP